MPELAVGQVWRRNQTWKIIGFNDKGVPQAIQVHFSQGELVPVDDEVKITGLVGLTLRRADHRWQLVSEGPFASCGNCSKPIYEQDYLCSECREG